VPGLPAERSLSRRHHLALLCLAASPLNVDFFTQLQRITTKRHQETIDSVLADVLSLFGPNFSLTLEEYFTQLEAMIAMSGVARVGGEEYSRAALQSMRSNLLEGLSAVLEEAADVAKTTSVARTYPCGYHDELIRALQRRDTIISFNYDCVVDHALRREGNDKWSAKYGYGFPRPPLVEGWEVWSASGSAGT
jgi:hypothetical protein